MKAILTINMVFSHTISMLPYFWGNSAPKLIRLSFTYISLLFRFTTFTSFMFCFGFVFYFAYLRKFNNSKQKIMKNGINTLIIYYISAFGIYIIDNQIIDLKTSVNILTLNYIVCYSEFLLSYAFISFLCIFAGNYILKMTSNYRILIVSSFCFAICSFFIPYSMIPSQLGIFIGSTKFVFFPIFLYLPYFLFGVYIARNNIYFNKYVFISTAFLSFLGVLYITIWGIPRRFPPSFFWLTLSFFYTYCLYLFCVKISKIDLGAFFKRIGDNTLLYLLISNLVLRYFTWHKPFNAGFWGIFIVTGAIFLFTNQLIKIVRK